MKFLTPYWLWAVVLLPFAYWIFLRREKLRRKSFQSFANQELWSQIAPEYDFRARMRKVKLWLMAVGLGFIALARPQFGSHEEKVSVLGMDVMFVVDVSNSMEVEDIVPSRLKKAKHLIRTMVEQLEGDRSGIVAFAASSYLACPLTTDLPYLADTIQILSPKMISAQGTNIGLGLETALKALERGGEESVGSKSSETSSHAIILISDGEDHEDQAQAIPIAEKLKQAGIQFYVIGVGTQKGGPVPIKDDQGQLQGFKKDRNNQPILSRFHSDFLKKLAELGGGKYWDASDSEREVQVILHDLSALTRSEYMERRLVIHEDRFQLPLAIALVLLFLELSIPARKLILLLLFLISTPSAKADDLLKKSAPLDTYYENQNGIKAFQEGKIEEAEKSFGAAQARDPSRPELEFNQGVVQFEQGNIDRAIENFKNSSQLADQNQDRLVYGKSQYNLGKAYTKKGVIKESVRSYLQAIKAAQMSKDTKLENESRKNLELLLEEIKQEKQRQQQEQKQKQEQEKEQQQQQQSEQSKQEEKESQQGQNQDKVDQNGMKKDSKDNQSTAEVKQKKQQFQSKKMSSEDADRVMTELSTKDRELYEKLQRQNAKPGNNSKDW